MKKVKQVFPSRNYITIDCAGDVEIVFNPVGDGTEGDDILRVRKGRWAFRCNDFLAGKMMPNGEKEGMNRKIYSLNLVYDDNDGEPIISTTYVDPSAVIPLDGSLVSIANAEELATSENQLKILEKFNDLGSFKFVSETLKEYLSSKLIEGKKYINIPIELVLRVASVSPFMSININGKGVLNYYKNGSLETINISINDGNEGIAYGQLLNQDIYYKWKLHGGSVLDKLLVEHTLLTLSNNQFTEGQQTITRVSPTYIGFVIDNIMFNIIDNTSPI